MEERDASVLTRSAIATDGGEHALLEQIQRELDGLDLPCTCKEELSRTIVAIETWRLLKARKALVRGIKDDYDHLVTGVSFLTDLKTLDHAALSADELRDHAESLKFLSDYADRCARRLNELATLSDA